MRRRLLLITIVALLLSVSGAEGSSATEDVAPSFSVLSNATLSCSARLPATVVGCFIERPLLVLFNTVELALGIDAQAAFSDAHRGHLAPYLVAAYYGDALSAWIELRLPELAGLHPPRRPRLHPSRVRLPNPLERRPLVDFHLLSFILGFAAGALLIGIAGRVRPRD